MIKFIEICQKKGLLTDWTIAIKRGGSASKREGKGVLTAKETNLPGDIQLAIRKGPDKNQGPFRDLFIEQCKFRATGGSANIVSSSRDLGILLSDGEIQEAENTFRAHRKQFLLKKHPEMTELEAEEKTRKVTIPERVYREKIDEDKGLLVIYLFDSYYSFNQKRGKEDGEFSKFVEEGKYDLDIPIIGYALGFPPLEKDPGGEYVKGDYNLSLDEDSFEGDVEMEDLGLPDDI